MPSPFENPELRDWFFQDVDASGMFPRGIATLGSYPFDEHEFDDFLKGLGITAHAPSHELNVLVVGQQEWKAHLHEAIELRRGKDLRVYSQEMFLSLLRTGFDPLEDPTVAEFFGKGHLALEYIQEWGFDWPNTRIVPVSTGSTSTIGPRERSRLKIFGYTVGAKGGNQQQRRLALTKAFYGDFTKSPELKEFMPKWGNPESGTRLKKMTEHISMDVKLRSRGRWPEADKHWLEDLKWLKATFYDGKYTFHWPSPNVS